VRVVYLRPDNYKAAFETNGFLSYSATGNFEEIKKPGAYVVYAYGTSDKKIELATMDHYYTEDVQKILDASVLYNLPIDPHIKPANYAGEYGLCIANGVLRGLKDNVDTCSSTKFAKLTKYDKWAENFLRIKYSYGNETDVQIFDPKCDIDSRCSVTLNDKKKIDVDSKGYTLTNIFANPTKYCYKEVDKTIDIKWSGSKS
jgi:hypothetical protein